ncbi:hypothetical protein TRVL_05070 [Trypanosoma vivax]|nr:hypothetical protein TRVL_05070 [Trypanosoma vivax]
MCCSHHVTARFSAAQLRRSLRFGTCCNSGEIHHVIFFKNLQLGGCTITSWRMRLPTFSPLVRRHLQTNMPACRPCLSSRDFQRAQPHLHCCYWFYQHYFALYDVALHAKCLTRIACFQVVALTRSSAVASC